jgi:CheY-like chemotaxis protein
MELPAEKPILLIVDDDPNQQRLLGLLLGKHFVIESAATVAEGTGILEKQQIDAVLLDLTLAGDEDGLTLVRHLRKQPRFEELPVIGVSGHDSPEYEQAAIAAGCNHYLVKPVNKLILIERIEMLLATSSSG